MQDLWLNTKTNEIQNFADKHCTKRFFYAAFKQSVVQPPQDYPLFSTPIDQLSSPKSHILQRCA